MSLKQQVTLFLFLVSVSCSLAKPYYYYFQDEAAQKLANEAAAQTGQQQQQLQAALGDQLQAGAQPNQAGQLPQRITGHLGQLYNHGSSAVKSVVDTVQPDLKNIGQDLTEVYHVTGDNVGKKIEPLAQNVKPYIDQAQKVVAPYVNQAKEEVPKLIHQAGPALTKVGEQVRDGISGVWDKLKSVGNQEGGAQVGGAGLAQTQQVNAGQVLDNTKQLVSNTIQQAAEPVSGAAASAQQ